ncbi:MAG: hypothetical protein ACI4M0_00600 [Christensenellales bacterium]
MKKQYQLSEFHFYDGEAFITFNLIDIDIEKRKITVAVSNRGKINVRTFDLLEDQGRLYFEFGVGFNQIDVDDFEEVEE